MVKGGDYCFKKVRAGEVSDPETEDIFFVGTSLPVDVVDCGFGMKLENKFQGNVTVDRDWKTRKRN